MSVYLDYNATAPLKPEVLVAMHQELAMSSNPSSVHRYGRDARKKIEAARTQLGEILSVFPREITFISSATEANNWVLNAFSARPIIASAIEHTSILKACENVTPCPVNESGTIDLAALDSLLSSTPGALVSVMLANNETGVIQPVAEVKSLCAKYEALFHCDAVQGLGKIDVDAGLIGADLLTIAGHKCGGPVGAAALVIRGNTSITSWIKGGGQEHGRRAGTENVPAIMGFAKAAELAGDKTHMHQLRTWLDAIEAEISATAPTAIIFGAKAKRLPNTSCIALPGVSQEVQMIHFDLGGIAVSAGSACSSGRIEPSHVLKAMGASPELAGSAIRVSAGWATTQSDISAFANAWKILYSRRLDAKSQPAA